MTLADLTPFPPAQHAALAVDADRRWHCRSLGSADLPWLLALYASTREQELMAVPWPAPLKQQFLAQQFAAQHQHYLGHYPAAHYLAIECEGQPVGRCYLDDTGEACDRLVDISLFPPWRGHGIGSALIQGLQKGAAARGRGLALHVMAHNLAAERLYARLGFIAQGASADALYLPMCWYPAADRPAASS